MNKTTSNMNDKGKGNYTRFTLMLGSSFIVMYSVMFMNVDRFNHIYLNLNRLYMTILMVAPMALIMLGFMSSMYKNKKLNRLIIGISTVAIIGAFLMLRNQAFVNDQQFMRSMIPHHSSAILVSQEAQIKDPELKKLAREIIKSQEEEIAQMKKILSRME